MASIIIAGGGIGGLATALATAATGHTVTVLERRTDFEELGAGIQLAPNGLRALERLGVAPGLGASAVRVDELRLMDGVTGEHVRSLPLDQRYRNGFGHAYSVVQRADLYSPLVAACRRHDRITLRTASAVQSYRRRSDGVAVRLDSGERVTGHALIGADGLRSAVRRRLLGDGEPRPAGHTIYRTVIPMAEVPHPLRCNAVTLWAGPGWHLVHYPLGGGRLLNVAATRADGDRTPVAGEPVPRDAVLAAFPGPADRARRVLELGRGWRRWTLADRDPAARWTDGPVVLLGDAAHPMLQYAAQGACQALEDAVLLGDLLAGARGAADCAARFAWFQQQRHARATRTTLVSRALGQLYHAAGSEARTRNATLAALTDDELFDKVAWLHGTAPHPAVVGAAR
jgi:salicylate hydroxylase